MTPRALLALAALTILATGCGQAAPPPAKPAAGSTGSASGAPADWDALLAAARKEGTLTVYSSPGSNARKMDIDAFQEAYPGISVEGSFVSASEQVSRLTLERQAGRYLADVLVEGTADIVTTFKDAHFTAPLQPQLVLPEVLDTSGWLQNHLWWTDSAEPYTNLQFEGDVNPILFVNPKLVDASSFKSFYDLLDPKWKGKIASTDIRAQGKGAAQARFVFKQPELGPQYLTRLYSEMNVRLSDDQTQLINWVAQGAYPMAIFLSLGEVGNAVKQGLPIAPVSADQFKEGAPIGPGAGSVALVDRAPHPNAAKLYINWLLSKQGQTAWQKIIGTNSLRVDIPKTGVDPLIVPKQEGSYANTGNEEYSRVVMTSIRTVIDDALKNAKS